MASSAVLSRKATTFLTRAGPVDQCRTSAGQSTSLERNALVSSRRQEKAVRLSSSHFHANLLAVSGVSCTEGISRRCATIRGGMKEAEDLVRARTVRPISYKDLHQSLTAAGEGNAYTMLDVRPEWEYAKAHSRSSLHVPLFVEHDGKDIGTLIAKWFALGYGGLWMGIRHTKVNVNFLNEVKKIAPKERRLLVSCGDGLRHRGWHMNIALFGQTESKRSLLAAEVLHNAGYRNVAWLEGGFRFVENNDLPDIVGNTKIKYAQAGGIAGILLNTVDLFKRPEGEST